VNDELIAVLEEIYGQADGHDLDYEPSGFFVVAADNPDAKVLGILRPRFVPNTQDAQAGWADLRDKAAYWKQTLKSN